MVRTCKVKDCINSKLIGTDARLKVTLFTVPKSPEIREKWSQILESEFTGKVCICDRHFHPSDIKTKDITRDIHGNILYEYQLQRKRLVSAALPCSHKYIACNNNNIRVEKTPSMSIKKFSDMTVLSQVDNGHNVNKKQETYSKSSEVLNKENLSQTTIKDEYEIQSVAQELECKSNFTDEYKLIEQKIFALPLTQNLCEMEHKENLYYSILAQKEKIKLPTSKWALHCCFDKQKLIFSDVEVLLDVEENKSVIPRFLKQIIVGSDSQIQLRMLGQNFELDNVVNTPESLLDFQKMLFELDELQICTGGPLIRNYKNINPECAYKDVNVWRHNKCSITLNIGTICSNCLKLSSNFSKLFNKKKINVRVRLEGSPAKKKKHVRSLSAKRVVKQQFSRIEKRLEILQEKDS